MGYSTLPISKFYGSLFLTGLILFQYFPPLVYADESKTIERLIELTEPRGQAVQEKVARINAGKKAYMQFCVHCHGLQGQGDGKASAYLRPFPRDLSLGIFKFRSTPSNALPLNEDLYRTIRQGVPGTAMPAWGEVLAEETLISLVEYIKYFSSRFQIETPDFIMPIGLEPPYERRSIEKGRILYKELRCGRCHGEKGERSGQLDNKLTDAWGNPSVVYDLKQPRLYKAGYSSEEIYHTLVTGLDGTPMNTYDYVPAGDLWHLVHFLQSQHKNEEIPPLRVSQKIVSNSTSKKIGASPEDILWKGIWEDETPEIAKPGANFYMDAVALQFSSLSRFDLIYYGMGERQKPVNIWHWKADSFQIVEGQSQIRNKFAVNPFSEKSVEEMNASGFGTLTVQSLEDQQVVGKGRWKNGKWTVVFLRNLKTASPFDIQFLKSANALVAFALWDGQQKEKNANKRVSFWQQLLIP